jgi:hypothetical protein
VTAPSKLLNPGLVFVGIVCSGPELLFPLQALSEDRSAIQAIEKEMAERPLEALAIARRAPFVDAEDRKRLFSIAARYQEKQLRNLSEAQVVELAKVFEDTLGDQLGALRVRLGWLRQRAMTQEEVVRLLGQPKRVSWQILYRHQIEQWAYEDPAAVRIDFDCVKGQDPRFLRVHSLSSKNR